MTITRTDHNQRFDKNGVLLSDVVVQTDVTTQTALAQLTTLLNGAISANKTNLPAAAVTATLTANTAYLGIANPTQVQVNTQVAALTGQLDAILFQVSALTDQSSYTMSLVLWLLGHAAALNGFA